MRSMTSCSPSPYVYRRISPLGRPQSKALIASLSTKSAGARGCSTRRVSSRSATIPSLMGLSLSAEMLGASSRGRLNVLSATVSSVRRGSYQRRSVAHVGMRFTVAVCIGGLGAATVVAVRFVGLLLITLDTRIAYQALHKYNKLPRD